MSQSLAIRPILIFFEPEARFAKYLTTLLRLSYDNDKVTIDLRRTIIAKINVR